MSDHVKRLICRLLFVVCCVVPTCIVLKWIVSPPTATEWQDAIKQRTGLSTAIGSISTPYPQQTILHDVRLAVPETSSEIELGSLLLTNAENRRTITIGSIELGNRSLVQIIRRLHSGIREVFDVRRPIEIRIESAAISAENQRHVLRNVLVNLIPKAKSIDVVVRFQSGSNGDAAPWSEIRFSRQMDDPTVDSWNFDFSQKKIPLVLIAEWSPFARSLGELATFQGIANVNVVDAAWDAQVMGHLDQIDLYACLSETFGRFVGGTGAIVLRSCAVKENKLINAEGIVSGFGRMEKEMYFDLVRQFAAVAPTLSPHVAEQFYIPFETQSGFSLDSGMIQLAGDASGNILISEDIQGPGLVVRNSAFPIERLLQVLGKVEQPQLPSNVAHLAQHIQFAEAYSNRLETAVETSESQGEQSIHR
ncbi:MAG TPA: hypothetical protein PKD64_17720 [Pirellulaceae bacterium]|nr:hypothetical protein [Pirellulaceae bacterium]HMO94027.1 hypothetical protein [Pirellulaceae bacterium]HMP70788.1 hypothetical protein [Pirellulaceae bacterium]